MGCVVWFDFFVAIFAAVVLVAAIEAVSLVATVNVENKWNLDNNGI